MYYYSNVFCTRHRLRAWTFTRTHRPAVSTLNTIACETLIDVFCQFHSCTISVLAFGCRRARQRLPALRSIRCALESRLRLIYDRRKTETRRRQSTFIRYAHLIAQSRNTHVGRRNSNRDDHRKTEINPAGIWLAAKWYCMESRAVCASRK